MRSYPPFQRVIWFCALLFATLAPNVAANTQERPKIQVSPQFPHSWWVVPLAVSRDGARILSTDGDHEYDPAEHIDCSLKLWDVASRKLIRIFDGHNKRVKSAAFSPDGRRLVSGGYDYSLKLWDVASGKLIRSIANAHEVGVNSVAYSPDGKAVLSGSWDGSIKLWDAASGKLIRSYGPRKAGEFAMADIHAVAFAPNGKRIASGDGEGKVTLWDVPSGKVIRTFRGKHKVTIASVKFSPDGSRLISWDDKLLSPGFEMDDKATLKLWNVNTGKLIRVYVETGTAAFLRDGRRIVAATPEHTLLLDAATGKVIKEATAGELVDLHKAAVGELVLSFGEDVKDYRAAAFSGDGTRILVQDKNIPLWDVNGGLLGGFLKNPKLEGVFALSSDGTLALSEAADHALQLRNAVTGELIHRLEGHNDKVLKALFSSSGARILSLSQDNTLKLWNTATGKLIRNIELTDNKVFVYRHNFGFSPGGERFFEAAWAGGPYIGPQKSEPRLWDSATGELIGSFNCAYSTAFSSDGTRVLCGDSAKIYDAVTGENIRSFTGHSGSVTAVAFSPDGVYALTGSDDHTAKLWDAGTGTLIRTFDGHRNRVKSVAFSPDGKRVLTTSFDGGMRLWDVATGKELLLMLTSQSGEWLAITPAGFFDASDGGVQMLVIVRGLKPLPMERFRARLQRKDIIRALFLGDSRAYEEAAAKLDLEKILGEGASKPPRQ